MADLAGWINNGIIVRPGTGNAPASERTFIVSGYGRGGTTMVAAALRDAGIPMGERFHEAAVEDIDARFALREHDRTVLQSFIAHRNRQHSTWGFKCPNIHALVRHHELAQFRNPHLILVFRDPVAITRRTELSDYMDPLAALLDITLSVHNLVRFFTNTTCPALLLSYEKALIFPDIFVDSLTDFCELPNDATTRQRLLRQVIPNSKPYADGTTVKIAGYLEALRGNTLLGWCTYVNFMEPVALDLFLNEKKLTTFTAQTHRPDLARAGFGNGDSGFEVDLTGIAMASGDRLHVRLNQRPLFELQNSGRTVAEYRQGDLQ